MQLLSFQRIILPVFELTPRPPLLRREGEQKPPSLCKGRGLGDEFKKGAHGVGNNFFSRKAAKNAKNFPSRIPFSGYSFEKLCELRGFARDFLFPIISNDKCHSVRILQFVLFSIRCRSVGFFYPLGNFTSSWQNL